jgi:hypothetical protein
LEEDEGKGMAGTVRNRNERFYKNREGSALFPQGTSLVLLD